MAQHHPRAEMSSRRLRQKAKGLRVLLLLKFYSRLFYEMKLKHTIFMTDDYYIVIIHNIILLNQIQCSELPLWLVEQLLGQAPLIPLRAVTYYDIPRKLPCLCEHQFALLYNMISQSSCKD